jgi:hypothetical protein
VFKTESLTKLIQTILVACSLTLLAFMPVLALKIYFADSEIWSVNLGYHFIEDVKHSWVFSRAIFYSLIYLSTAFFEKSEWIFYAARCLMCINLFLQVFLVQKILNVSFKNRLLNWIATLFLLTNTYYLTQAYRIRSDLLAMTFVLLTIWMILQSKNRLRTFFVGICLLLLTTPKSIFIAPVLLIFFLFLEPDKKKRRFPLLILAAGIAFYISALILRLGALSDFILNLNSYLMHSFEGKQGGAEYFSARAFTYIVKLCKENFIFVGVTLAPIFLSLQKKFWQDSKNRMWFCVHIYTLLVLLLITDKLPFFICSLLPLLTCSTAFLIYNNLRDLKLKPQVVLIVFTWIGIVSFYSIEKSVWSIQNDSNKEQVLAINAVEKYLDQYPDLTYYDVIGIIPRKSHLRHFAGPHQEEINALVAKIIMNEQPDLILRVAKFWFFNVDMSNFLFEHYIDIGNGFYLRAFPGPKKVKGVDELQYLGHKEKLAYVSPLFEKYKDTELIFKTKDDKGNNRLYLGSRDYALEKHENVQILRITPFPYPQTMPGKSLNELFRFDAEF